MWWEIPRNCLVPLDAFSYAFVKCEIHNKDGLKRSTPVASYFVRLNIINMAVDL